MLQDSMQRKRLPDSLYEANICVILKKGKAETDPANYRPIALLNFDQKVLTKILASRLAQHISTIIHPDQTGRFTFCNVRLLLIILYSDHQLADNSAAVISLDEQKAFDQIEWPYMFETLKQFGFGDKFINWIKIVYFHPSLSVLTNGIRSSSFELNRGVRQGDPLSPLLFNIALEPLAVGIRTHPHIHGISLGNAESMISLYADDLLLYITDPVVSVPKILDYIDTFSKLSGYTINWSKSEFLPLTNKLSDTFLSSIPFKIVDDHFTYLGLKISKNPKQLFNLNFLDMINKLKRSIESWKLLPLSLIGRVNVIKMNTLPKFLYLFQNLGNFF